MTNAKESYEAQILDKLIGNSERLAVIELTVTQTKAEIKVLNNKVEVLDNKVEVLDSKIKVLDNKVEVLDNKVEILDNKVEVLNNEVNKLNNEQQKISSKLNNLEKTIEQINSNQKWFFTILASIGTGILATLYSQPILNALSKLS